MKIKLIAYGIARDILSRSSLDYELTSDLSIGELKSELSEKYSDFEKLQSLRFAVGEEYRQDDYVLKENEEVVIIPPVSGG